MIVKETKSSGGIKQYAEKLLNREVDPYTIRDEILETINLK